MYAIYGNIYHQYTPNVSIYTSTMDPMGYIASVFFNHRSTTLRGQRMCRGESAGCEADGLGDGHFSVLTWEILRKNIEKTWKITIFNGKTHYFYGHFQ